MDPIVSPVLDALLTEFPTKSKRSPDVQARIELLTKKLAQLQDITEAYPEPAGHIVEAMNRLKDDLGLLTAAEIMVQVSQHALDQTQATIVAQASRIERLTADNAALAARVAAIAKDAVVSP